MKALLVVVVLVCVFALVGWVTFNLSPGDASVTLETDKIKQDTQKVVDKSKEAFQDTKENLSEALDDDDTVPPTVDPAPLNR